MLTRPRGGDVVCVLAPVLGRPERVERLVQSLASSRDRIPLHILFVVSPSDQSEIDALQRARADYTITPFEWGPGDYARKVNHGIEMTDEPFLLQGADDLSFEEGWAEHAVARSRADDVGVVGTNDMGNGLVKAGRHSTHSLVARWYVEQCGTIDEPGKLLHEGYRHNWVDNELVQTARFRGCWAFEPRAKVEHLHPLWGKGETDHTYELGQEGFHDDARLFQQRRSLWESL